MAYIDIDVDPVEFYNGLDRSEKEEIVDLLTEDGFIKRPIIEPDLYTIQKTEFNIACAKLANSYYRLTEEEEETIMKIVKKYN